MGRSSRSKSSSTISYKSKGTIFSISNPSYSPSKRSDKGFSGPIVSIIPKDAQHKKRSNSGNKGEPTSPKISCIGQIKNKKKEKKTKKSKRNKRLFCSCFNGMFRRKVRHGGGPPKKETEERTKKLSVPQLGKIRKYQSGRETLAGFDWRKTMEERNGEVDDETFIPHSAPILVGGGAVATEPKKEVNLWRRRDMPPPIPLQIERN